MGWTSGVRVTAAAGVELGPGLRVPFGRPTVTVGGVARRVGLAGFGAGKNLVRRARSRSDSELYLDVRVGQWRVSRSFSQKLAAEPGLVGHWHAIERQARVRQITVSGSHGPGGVGPGVQVKFKFQVKFEF